jgi:hypothetical protein
VAVDFCSDKAAGRPCNHHREETDMFDPMTPDPEGDINTEAVNDR